MMSMHQFDCLLKLGIYAVRMICLTALCCANIFRNGSFNVWDTENTVGSFDSRANYQWGNCNFLEGKDR